MTIITKTMNFKDCPKLDIHDDYYTRPKSWEQIIDFIPKDKVIWEACMLNSNTQSRDTLRGLGLEVVGETNIDCLKENHGDMIITNPPFSTDIKKQILQRLVELDKPFILIMNSTNLFSKYFKEIFEGKDIFFIYPTSKLHFDKYEDGECVESKNNTSFYSIYVCYKVIYQNIWL
jgi:hypothetical protein